MAAKLSIVAVVPMKPLAESKTRLSSHLSGGQRATLALSMLGWVIQTLGRSRAERIVVVGGDSAVRDEALGGGAEWIEDDYLDLNMAVESAFESVWRGGASAAYVPADLPLLTASDVDGMIEASEGGRTLTMCPAHDGGTNGLVAPPDLGFRPLLGADSFSRHETLAKNLNLKFRNYRSDGFFRDVDTIEDLRVCVDMSPPCLVEIAKALEDARE